jgi:hypothetical protein
MQATDVIDRVKRLNWTGPFSAWRSSAETASLRFEEGRGSRRTFRDPAGNFWDVYASGEEVRLVEIQIAVTEIEEGAGDDVLDALEVEYREKFAAVEGELTSLLGPPALRADWGAPEFPDDQEAVSLSEWRAPPGRVMLQIKNEGVEYPFRLNIVVSPTVGGRPS